jgi:DNA-directed RNA polymerase subunit omega
MARITVEDCVSLVSNRFELCVLASYRAKEISRGSPVTIARHDNDKNTVTSLREIAESGVSVDALRDSYIRSLHSNTYFDDVSEEDTQNIAAELMETTEKHYIVETKSEDNEDSYISVDDYTFEDEDDSEK